MRTPSFETSGSVDLTFDLVRIRLDERRSMVASERLVDRPTGAVFRLRRSVGTWLIAVGQAISTPPSASRDALTR